MVPEEPQERSNLLTLPVVAVAVAGVIALSVGITGQISNATYRDSEPQWVSEEITSLREDVSDLTAQVAVLTERLDLQSARWARVTTPPPDPESERIEPRTRPRRFEDWDTNEHCRGPYEVSWRVRAEEGWHIDVDSVSARAIEQSSRSVFHGVSEVSEEGFTVSGRLVNHGECVRAFGATVGRDVRGTLRVSVEYTEVEIIDSE